MWQSRIAGLMPNLVVNENNLFDWIFQSHSTVRYRCHENVILERTIAAANNETGQVRTNLRVNRLLDIDCRDNAQVDNGNEEEGGIAEQTGGTTRPLPATQSLPFEAQSHHWSRSTELLPSLVVTSDQLFR
jgi:hypothetical protein